MCHSARLFTSWRKCCFYWLFFEQNAKWHLIIQIVLSRSIGFTEGSNNNRGFFDMVACANSKVYVKSKYTTNEILEYEMKPSIDMNSLSMEGFTGSRTMPLVTIFQANGGPDQNIHFLCTRIAALALFFLSGANHSIFFSGCLGESYWIFCERIMSLLNIPVINCLFVLY